MWYGVLRERDGLVDLACAVSKYSKSCRRGSSEYLIRIDGTVSDLQDMPKHISSQ